MTAQDREDGKIVCMIDMAPCHSIEIHLRENYPDIPLDQYRRDYPDAPLFSEKAKEIIAKKRAKKAADTGTSASSAVEHQASAPVEGKRGFHEVFNLGKAAAAMSSKGTPIMIDVFPSLDPDLAAFFPQEDPKYIFNIEQTKNVIISLALGMNTYLWGYHGSGKTSQFEQIAFRTNRPWVRLQHTADMESSHVIGQYVVKDGATVWQDGPLPIAMKIGAMFCADEYDTAMPGVVALYQGVMEGKPLVIKEAPPEYRVVRAHPNFRFCATGNTNGGGDDTGLYQGTQIMNAANYSRFGMTMKVDYLDADTETMVIAAQANMQKSHAKMFVDFARSVREAYGASTIGCIASTREMINAATLGLVKGGAWREGLNLAFINRQSRVDADVLSKFSQRIFG